MKIDISDKEVQKSVGDFDLGFSIQHDLKQLALQKRDRSSSIHVQRRGCQFFN